jgi:hypothetical protein
LLHGRRFKVGAPLPPWCSLRARDEGRWHYRTRQLSRLQIVETPLRSPNNALKLRLDLSASEAAYLTRPILACSPGEGIVAFRPLSPIVIIALFVRDLLDWRKTEDR